MSSYSQALAVIIPLNEDLNCSFSIIDAVWLVRLHVDKSFMSWKCPQWSTFNTPVYLTFQLSNKGHGKIQSPPLLITPLSPAPGLENFKIHYWNCIFYWIHNTTFPPWQSKAIQSQSSVCSDHTYFHVTRKSECGCHVSKGLGIYLSRGVNLKLKVDHCKRARWEKDILKEMSQS